MCILKLLASKDFSDQQVGGRILYDLKETKVAYYAWGLGVAPNNLEKNYTLLKGLLLAKETKVRSLIVLGDSLVIVKVFLGK
jgi:hypothetical protein